MNSEVVKSHAISGVLEKDDRWLVFNDDVEIDVIDGFLPKICGFLLSTFTSGCGVRLDHAFKTLRNEDVNDVF